MNAAPSTPPPATSSPAEGQRAKYIPRRPVTKTRTPGVYAGELRAAVVLDELMRRLGVSNVELAECMGVPESVVRRLRSGDLPLKVGHVYAIERRFSCRLFDAFHADRSAASNDPTNHE